MLLFLALDLMVPINDSRFSNDTWQLIENIQGIERRLPLTETFGDWTSMPTGSISVTSLEAPEYSSDSWDLESDTSFMD